jgi:hypothetical protein
MAGFLVDWGGYQLDYSRGRRPVHLGLVGAVPAALDPASAAPGGVGRAPCGLASVLDGLRFLGTRPNIRMTFLSDMCAMILAMPRALFPAVAALAFGGGAETVGVMAAAIALGSMAAMLFSGRLGQLRPQGLAVVVCVALWGVSVSGFGLASALPAPC